MSANFLTEKGLKIRLNSDFFFEHLTEEQFQALRFELEVSQHVAAITSVAVSLYFIITNAGKFMPHPHIILIYLFVVGIGLYARYFVMPFLIRLLYGFIYQVTNILGGIVATVISITLTIAVIYSAYVTGNKLIIILYLGARLTMFVFEQIMTIFTTRKLHAKYNIALTSVEILSFRLLMYYEYTPGERHKNLGAVICDYVRWREITEADSMGYHRENNRR